MTNRQIRLTNISASLGILLLVSLGCKALIPGGLDGPNVVRTQTIGFDFTQSPILGPEGDTRAPDHIFIHQYPMPSDGEITGVIYLADSDDVPETMTLLILRPDREGWRVVHSVSLPADDLPVTTSGIAAFHLDSPLSVQEGDVFAHWQPEAMPTGPIPQNVEEESLDGKSVGKFGFRQNDVEAK